MEWEDGRIEDAMGDGRMVRLYEPYILRDGGRHPEVRVRVS